MKVSEWLRQYQLTGAVPEEGDPALAFWCGWMTGHARSSPTITNLDEARELAIKAAEFIESRAKE